jgi:hypothetical protein
VRRRRASAGLGKTALMSNASRKKLFLGAIRGNVTSAGAGGGAEDEARRWLSRAPRRGSASAVHSVRDTDRRPHSRAPA